jgi:hypothetical protein
MKRQNLIKWFIGFAGLSQWPHCSGPLKLKMRLMYNKGGEDGCSHKDVKNRVVNFDLPFRVGSHFTLCCSDASHSKYFGGGNVFISYYIFIISLLYLYYIFIIPLLYLYYILLCLAMSLYLILCFSDANHLNYIFWGAMSLYLAKELANNPHWVIIQLCYVFPKRPKGGIQTRVFCSAACS